MSVDVKPDLGSPFGVHETTASNMPLRDYFAGQALIGVMVMRAAIRDQDVDDVSQESIAEEAYEIADAMLEAREKARTDGEG